LIDAVATGIYEVENGKPVMVKDPTDARMGIEL
jgi:hypothetical protein